MIHRTWKQSSLSEVCEINPGKKELQDKSKEMEVSFLPMAAVSEDGKILTQERRKLKEVIKGYTNFQEGDVLLAKITPCFENGKRAIAKNLVNGFGFGSTEFHVLRPRYEVTSNWIFYAISRSDFCNIAKSQMTGTAGQKRVPARVLEQFRIPIPPIKEQENISEAIETQFTRLDVAIKNLKTIKTKLKTYRKSVLKAAFEGEKGWVEKRMGDISEVTSSKRIFRNEYVDSGIPFYRTKEIVELSQNRDIGIELFISDRKYSEIKKRKFDVPKKNEILLSAVGTIGISWVIKDDREFYFKDGNLLWIKRVNNIDPYFLKYYLDFLFLKGVKNIASGTAYKALTIEKLKDFRISFPRLLSEQKKVVQEIESHFSVIDKLEATVDRSLKKTEKLRKSILKAAFEGKLVN